jgi:uncharacterized protein DUF6338
LETLIDAVLKQGGLIAFVVWIVPGFIAWQVSQWRRPHGAQKTTEAFFTIFVYSVLNQIVWFGRSWTAWPTSLSQEFVLSAQHLGTPIVIAILVQAVLDLCAHFGLITSPHPRAWDSLFNDVALNRGGLAPNGVFLVATLTDGAKVGGLYANPGFASLWPYDRDLLLGQMWELEDGKPMRAVSGSIGMYLSASSIQTLEVFDWASVVDAAVRAEQERKKDG